jgi:hypothetical protein
MNSNNLSVTAIVVKMGQIDYLSHLKTGQMSPFPTPAVSGMTEYMAYLVVNPEVKGFGATEEEAIAKLKFLITRCHQGTFRRVVEIELGELLAEEVMEG